MYLKYLSIREYPKVSESISQHPKYPSILAWGHIFSLETEWNFRCGPHLDGRMDDWDRTIDASWL